MKRGKIRYQIGEVAASSGLSIKTLHYYDRKGLLVPQERDPGNQYRCYTEKQLLEALMICELKNRGFTLSEMRNILKSTTIDDLDRILEAKSQTLKNEISNMQNQLAAIDSSRTCVLKSLTLTGAQSLDLGSEFQIRQMPAGKYIFTRAKSRIFADELFWDRCVEIYRLRDLGAHNVCGPLTAVFHEHYTRQFFFEDGDLELMLPVVYNGPELPHIKTLNEITVASGMFVGMYSEMLSLYIKLVKWIEESGYTISGHPIEEYLVEFSQGVSKDKYVTRISFPVEPTQST